MKTIGIFPNLDKDRALDMTREILAWLENRGVEVSVDAVTARLLCREDLSTVSWEIPMDLLIVLGGDGTLLGAAKAVARCGTPILGVNLGHLGFLTEVEMSDLLAVMPRVLKGVLLDRERMIWRHRYT